MVASVSLCQVSIKELYEFDEVVVVGGGSDYFDHPKVLSSRKFYFVEKRPSAENLARFIFTHA